jgi:hypothetical protein
LALHLQIYPNSPTAWLVNWLWGGLIGSRDVTRHEPDFEGIAVFDVQGLIIQKKHDRSFNYQVRELTVDQAQRPSLGIQWLVDVYVNQTAPQLFPSVFTKLAGATEHEGHRPR